MEEQLHYISATGSKKLLKLTGPEEEIEKLDAAARPGGGFDILFHREDGSESRNGFFLQSIGADGNLLSESSLGNQIVDHGLDDWFDFYVSGSDMVLLSRALATQAGVQSRRKKWTQNVVSWIDLETGVPESRLIPLDRRYLEAAMNAGDEGMQYLEGLPGGEPVLLTTLAGKPLVVSVGRIAPRQVVRLNEADHQLVAFTEAWDESQARLAKDAARSQRKVNREATMQRMQATQAEAAGMTLEQYNALSNSEQKEALVRSGNINQLMEAASRESEAMMATQGVQQNSPGQAPVAPQDMQQQIAAAMAQAQEQMANDPNIPPEMRAQMEAIMGQMGQATGEPPATMSGMPTQAMPQMRSAPQKRPVQQTVLPENALQVDSGKRGFIEYENKEGQLITLLIFDRRTGKEMLKKDYPDGDIYEYVDFNRFGLPLEHVGVIYRDAAGTTLEDLTPVIQP
jgi:hypothetical protein